MGNILGPHLNMSKLLLCVLVLLPIIGSITGGLISDGRQELFMKMINTHSTRIKRAACDTQGALDCIQRTTDTYLNAIFDPNYNPKPVPAGEKPDYQERKTCNFLMETEKCFQKLESCSLPAGDLRTMKDKAFKQARDAAKQLPNWDDAKCQSAGASFATSIFLVLVLAGFASKV